MCIRIEVWLQRIDDPDQSIEHEQDTDDPGNVARPVNEIAQQSEVNSEDNQAKGPVIPIGIEQKKNLGM